VQFLEYAGQKLESVFVGHNHIGHDEIALARLHAHNVAAVPVVRTS
jgi:hypothetical protein